MSLVEAITTTRTTMDEELAASLEFETNGMSEVDNKANVATDFILSTASAASTSSSTSNETIERQRWDLFNEASKTTTLMSIIPGLRERNELIMAALPTTVGNIVPLEQLIQQVVELATDDWQRLLLKGSSTRLVIDTNVIGITASADSDGSEIVFQSKTSDNKFIISQETLSTYSEKYPATDLYVLVSSSDDGEEVLAIGNGIDYYDITHADNYDITYADNYDITDAWSLNNGVLISIGIGLIGIMVRWCWLNWVQICNYGSKHPIIISILLLIAAVCFLGFQVEGIQDIFANNRVDCPCRLPKCNKTVKMVDRYLMPCECAKDFSRVTTVAVTKMSSKTNCGKTTTYVTTYYSDSKICTEEGNPLFGKCIGPKKMKESSQIDFEERIHPIDRLQDDFENWHQRKLVQYTNNKNKQRDRDAAKARKATKMSPAELAQQRAKARASRRRLSRFRAPSKLPTAENGGKTEKHATHPGIINEYNNDVSLYAKEMTEAMNGCPGT